MEGRWTGLKLYFLDEDSAGTRDKDDSPIFPFLLHRRGVIKIVLYNYRMNGLFNPLRLRERDMISGVTRGVRCYFINNI